MFFGVFDYSHFTGECTSIQLVLVSSGSFDNCREKQRFVFLLKD